MCNEIEGSYDQIIITIVTNLYLKKYRSFVDIGTVPLLSGITLYCGDTYNIALYCGDTYNIALYCGDTYNIALYCGDTYNSVSRCLFLFETFPIIVDGFATGNEVEMCFLL